jgi:hypothetical protein
MQSLSDSCSQWLPRVGKRVCTHNPFYLISAGLVIYGLHITLNGRGPRDEGLLVMAVLGGYTLLLAASAWLIIRFGQVWDDARTILLTLALLFVALSASFDRIALDDPMVGAGFLTVGFAFSVAVTEAVLAGLRMRLALRYRGPFYLQLALLFAYPAWLAYLSKSDQEPLMMWGVLLFPAVAGLALLTLWPAAHRSDRTEPNSGTPWRWPFYPWSLFVLVGVGMAARSYSLTMAFELSQGAVVGFRGFLIAPLLLAALVLFLELGITAGSRVAQGLALVFALPLVLLALPGPPANVAQANYYAMLTTTWAGPAIWTIGGVAAFYVWAWLRGVRLAEGGALFCLLLLSLMGPQTVDLRTLVEPNQALMFGIVAWLAMRSTWLRDSVYANLAIWIALANAWQLRRESWTGAEYVLVPIHLAWYSALVVGMLFEDKLARFIRACAPVALSLAAIMGAATYPLGDAMFPEWLLIVYELAVCVLAAAYARAFRRPGDFVALGICGSALAAVSGNWLYNYLERNAGLKGLAWLAWGLGCLAIGLFLSLVKGGLVRRIWRMLCDARSAATAKRT